MLGRLDTRRLELWFQCAVIVWHYTFADSLHCAHLATIFHGVEGEVNLRDRLFLADCPEGIIDLSLGGIVVNRLRLIFFIHDGRR